MELKKHDTELADRLHILDQLADKQLAKELMELHESKCRSCQEDRLSCTVRPACMNRNFLNTLIELGIEPQDLPDFCYSVYMDQLRRFILEGKGRGMNDRRLPIKDLLATLKVSSIRHFNTKFRKEWDNYTSVNEDNHLLVAGGKNFFHFDFTRGIVIVNPEHELIVRFHIFQLYVQVFSERVDVNAEASTITRNWWELRFEIPAVSESEKLTKFQKELPDSIANYAVITQDKKTEIFLEIIIDRQNHPLMVKELRGVFHSVASLKK